MATTDTQLQQLVINVGTEDQIAAGIASGTITEDMLSIATDGADITYDWVGTLAEYNTQQIATLHPDWLCFITDDVSNSGEDVYANVYSKTEANETFVAKTDGVAYLPNLLEFKWSDHLLNSVSWLRADTFSWQSGDIYEAVYDHLVDDITNASSETIHLYAWDLQDMGHHTWGTIYTKTENTPIDDVTDIYDVNGNQVSWRGPEHYYDYDYIERNSTEDVDISSILHTETIAGITISYYLVDDKHKICLADQEDNLIALFSTTGVAWYFILDTTNKRFKLPRTKFGFTGFRDAVGKYIAPGLPNITGYMTNGSHSLNVGNSTGSADSALYAPGTKKGATVAGNSGSDWIGDIGFDASRSNAIYGTSTTVQPSATEMYLYFYVGEFTDEALINTAGITTEEFNSKVDVNLLNSIPTSAFAQLLLNAGIDTVVDYQAPTVENDYTWYRKYKSGWVEQGGTYIGSTNSWVTTNLPITMKDINYQVVIKRTRRSDTGDPGAGTIDRRCFMTNGYTTTSFNHWGIWSTYPCDWEVKGMAAA